MKTWLIAIVLPTLLLSCSFNSSDDFYKKTQVDKGEIDSFELPRHAINDVVKGLAYQMLESSSFVNAKTPIAGAKVRAAKKDIFAIFLVFMMVDCFV